MGKIKKPKCVMVLTEGKSDRTALVGFFTELYSLIDEEIEVFFPPLQEEHILKEDKVEMSYDGDITSRFGINENNILPMILKMFIHPELEKHPAYKYPSSIVEIVHLVDIDGIYLADGFIREDKNGNYPKYPYYDIENQNMYVKDRDNIISRNKRKKKNIKKLVDTKKLRITIDKDSNESRDKNYRVFYFSSNIDHILFGDANLENYNKVPKSRQFSNSFFDEPLKMADYFVNHPNATKCDSYRESWENIQKQSDAFYPETNMNLLVKDLLKRANIRIDKLPKNDIWK